MTARRGLAVVAALVSFAVLAGGGTAVAAWNATASLSASASSTTIATALAQAGQLNTTYRYSGSSSTAATGSLTISNTGGAPLAYSLANQLAGSTALAQKTALILWTGTCSSTIPTTGTITTTLADRAPVLPVAARTLAARASVTVCIATRITGSDGSSTNAALQGQSLTAAFSVTGAVGTSWTTSATTSAITQTVYRLAAVTNAACTAAGAQSVTLGWSAPANRTANAAVTYRVYDTASGVDLASVTSSAAFGSVAIAASDFSRSGTYSLAIEAKESASGTTSPASATVSVVRGTILFIFPSLSCS
ncbi:hypothetical protein [Microbacterium sp. P05]|uniref:hypothetical protein n=1 Tax=Microbacterium sp. P05 TaxID=3366948 RepID=UPI0037453B03